MAPRVSLVLVSYNRSSSLERVIRSVLGQTFADFELIICDDASSDSSSSVILRAAASDPRVRPVLRLQNLSMPLNLSSGIELAAGEYVGFLHDDDWYDPDLIGCWVDALDQCGDAAFVFNSYDRLGPDDLREGVYREDVLSCGPGAAVLKLAMRRWKFDCPIWGTAMVRRAAFDSVGGLDRRFGLYADVDLWYRLLNRFHVCYVDRPLVGISHPESVARQWQSNWLREQRILEAIWLLALRQYVNCHVKWRLAVGGLLFVRYYVFVAVCRTYRALLQGRGGLAARCQFWLRARSGK